ncbi:uncharacterized protein LOC115923285 [Strongylocentrotus purpuratus]|uniref:Uncharacterized protein n=1 Tax=Strongylocentrotus purpuratus TaxID=7668 RepID=A0A7M7NQB4_STRPU|nr:uncharacterized protein LOC115923285 [Strongylocentrotus purpuratus]
MDVEKLVTIGESLGLTGFELRDFLKVEQDRERDKRAEERGRLKEEKELAEIRLKIESTFIKERKPKGLKEVIEIADCFVEARSGWQGGTGRSHTIKPTSPPLQAGSKPAGSKPSDRSQSRPGGCYICEKLGHQARHCTQRKRKEVAAAGAEIQSESDRTSSMPKQPQRQVHDRDTDSLPESTGRDKRRVNRHESEMYDVNACSCFSCTDGEGEVTEIQSELALPIVSVAGGAKPLQLMPVKEGIINGTRVKVLRDSGCSTTFVKMGLIKPDQFAGEERRCLMIDRTMRTFPVAKVTLDSPFFIGEVEALCVNNPIYDVVLGNIPGAREPKDPDEDWNGDACLAVETRNQRKKESKPIQKLKVPKQTDVATAEEFRKEQANDATLGRIREQAESGVVKTTRNGNRSLFRRKQGLLYREFQSASGDVTHQLVVPCKFRGQILRLAHECLLGRHLGSHKTAERILQNFFWGGVRADTSRFCRSCDVCQRSVYKGTVRKVPLGVTPLIDEPFHRVAVDIVGPIAPMTSRGCRYILTLMDYATRYPEAVPLKNIDTVSVAEALFSIFTRVGFPREMLTDRGTQFVSDVMQEVNRLMSVRHLTTTPYHPACNGLVEKFNGTLKQMLKKMAEERPTDWDRYIDALLFAYREAPHDSTGFSPFELLYGREVRGPLMILRELWANDESTDAETKTTYQYVMDLREKLENTVQLVKEQLTKSQSAYRAQYNKKAKARSFKVGDEVLLLFPTDRNKLLMHWKGPFKVVGRVGKLDYRVDLGSRITTFHANLLKAYYRRDDNNPDAGIKYPAVAGVSVIEEIDEDAQTTTKMRVNEQLIEVPSLRQTQTVADVSIGDTLSEEQNNQLRRLIGNYSDVFTDVPSVTSLGHHDIKLTDPRPVKSKPYPLPHALRQVVGDEVKEMLELGVIEPTNCSIMTIVYVRN